MIPHHREQMEKRSSAGFTLLEVTLATVISSTLLAGIILLNTPFLTQFNDAFMFQRLRHQVSHALSAIGAEIETARAVAVDPAACYALCLIESQTTNRILFYWSGSDLYRKTDALSASVSCTGGKPFALGLDVPHTAFSQWKESVTLALAQLGNHGAFFRLLKTVSPNAVERVEPFYEGFDCASTQAKGWTLGTGSASWSLQAATSGGTAYWLAESLDGDQGSALTASAEVPVDLSRTGKAFLRFKYRAVGTMGAGEEFKVYYNDGTSWNLVFKDDLSGEVGGLARITVDLDAYALSPNSRLRFDGSLRSSANAWILEEVSVVAK